MSCSAYPQIVCAIIFGYSLFSAFDKHCTITPNYMLVIENELVIKMKKKLPLMPPKGIKETWEGQFSVFSWYNFVLNVPSAVFIVTTLKENGHANAQLNAWGMMIGSGKEQKFLLHEEPGIVRVPRVKECFAHLECKLDWIKNVESEEKVNALIQGSIVSAAIDEAVLSNDMKESYAKRGFVFLLPEVINPVTGISLDSALASLDIENSVVV